MVQYWVMLQCVNELHIVILQDEQMGIRILLLMVQYFHYFTNDLADGAILLTLQMIIN